MVLLTFDWKSVADSQGPCNLAESGLPTSDRTSAVMLVRSKFTVCSGFLLTRPTSFAKAEINRDFLFQEEMSFTQNMVVTDY